MAHRGGERVSADNKTCVEPVMVGALAMLMALLATLAEIRFLFLIPDRVLSYQQSRGPERVICLLCNH